MKPLTYWNVERGTIMVHPALFWLALALVGACVAGLGALLLMLCLVRLA
jgi:hypothetical protein